MQRHLFLPRLATLLLATLLLGCQPLLPLTPIPTAQPQFQQATSTRMEQPVGLTANLSPSTIASDLDLTGTFSVPVTSTVAISTTMPLTLATDTSAVTTEVSAELVDAGKEVYLKQYCGICHQLDALETRGTFGPSHNGIGQRAAERIHDPSYHGHAQTAAE
ncbi:MAG: hypothetical protein KDE19_15035, partial [Caldilineaceae bacterium]|nr:hypothetical protein [Caldilineaceae bacterium]